MKLLFVYSAKFKKDVDGNYYTEGSINEELWKRYTNISDDFSVISRLDKYDYEVKFAQERYNTFNISNKKLIPIPDLFSSIKSFLNINLRYNFDKVIEENVIKNDYVIARVPSNEGYTAIKYAKKYNKPYLVEVVGCPWDALWNHSFRGKMLALPNYFAMKKAVKNAPFCLYVTNEFLQNRYPCNGKTIGCSDVILTPLDKRVLEKRLMKIEKMNEGEPIILGTTAAINVRYKGQEYVIKAIANLKKQGYKFEYHLAGGGDNSYLRSLAEEYDVRDQVVFLNSLPHEKVFEYLENIDIYVQPSKTEGLPRALVEAMSTGCPTIGSRVGGIPELVKKDFLFQIGSVEEICDLLKKMNKETLKNEAKRSFDIAKEYEKILLDERRTFFYNIFTESVGI